MPSLFQIRETRNELKKKEEEGSHVMGPLISVLIYPERREEKFQRCGYSYRP